MFEIIIMTNLAAEATNGNRTELFIYHMYTVFTLVYHF